MVSNAVIMILIRWAYIQMTFLLTFWRFIFLCGKETLDC